MTQAVPGLEVARAQTDADLEVMIAVRTAADPDRPPPRLENLRHNLAGQRDARLCRRATRRRARRLRLRRSVA